MTEQKIFFTDMDGTLLRTDKSFSPANRQALLDTLAAGYPVVFSTGRALQGVIRLTREAGLYLPGCYLICFNGGMIYDVGRSQILFESSVPIDVVLQCFAIAEDCGIHLQTYTGADRSTVVALHDNPHLSYYGRIQYLPHQVVPDIAAALTSPPPKLLAIESDRDKMDRFRARIEAAAGDRLDLFMSSDIYLEMVPPGINKGNAVRFLCDHLGIPVSGSVAAGDAENDLSMLDAAGVGAAMANAAQAVKSHADYVTLHDNDHDGVAEIIHKFILSSSSAQPAEG